MIFCAAQRLHPFTVRGRGTPNVFGYRCRPYEADGIDPGMVQKRIDGFFVAVDDIEYAVGQSGLTRQFGEAQAAGRIFLGRLEYECVAARDRYWVHPHGHHSRKVERGDAGTDAQRLTHVVAVDAASDVLVELTLEQLRDTACELNHFGTALNRTFGVLDGFAVLRGNDVSQFFFIVFQELKVFE